MILYRHLKPNGEVFYIGIGSSKKRAYSKQGRNNFWLNIVNKYPDYEVQILKKDLTKEEACELETILIEYYGRRITNEGSLCNLSKGGEGSNGYKFTDIQLSNLKKSRNNKKHPLAGKNHTEKVRKKMSDSHIKKQVVQMDLNENIIKIFKSLKEASIELNICKSLISKVATQKRKTTHGYKFKFINN